MCGKDNLSLIRVMNRHAYVIMAHNEPAVLAALVRMLDDARNDIFIHIDAGADIGLFRSVGKELRKSALYWVNPRRVSRWAAPSFTRAQIDALAFAKAKGAYCRYHLISGVDLPIKSQDDIHKICDETNSNREYIGFCHQMDESIASQWRYYNFFVEHLKTRPVWLSRFAVRMCKALVVAQRMIGLDRKFEFEVRKGANWVSLTDEFLTWFLENRRKFDKFLAFTISSDEKIFQTAVWNSPYRDRIVNFEDERLGCMREVDFVRGTPWTWRPADVDILLKSPCFFARKFSFRDSGDLISILESRFGGAYEK